MKYNCICCSNSIEKIYGLPKSKDWEGSFNGGIVEKIDAGYGSIHDGDQFVIAICDTCVNEKLNTGHLIWVGNYFFPNKK